MYPILIDQSKLLKYFLDGNILTLLTTLSFISITFCNTLKEKTSSIYQKINSYYESPVYHRHISKLMATAMRVFVTQADHDQSKALMIVGTTMAKRISENSLAPDAVQDVVSFFESYATISESKGQIIYFRILFMLLERQIETEQILQKFTLAAGQYPNSGTTKCQMCAKRLYFSSSAPRGRCVSETCSRKAAS